MNLKLINFMSMNFVNKKISYFSPLRCFLVLFSAFYAFWCLWNLIVKKKKKFKTGLITSIIILLRCSAYHQEIYSRAPMQKCYATFFEIAFPYGSPSVKLLHICRTLFWIEALGDCFWKELACTSKLYVLPSQTKMNKLEHR